MSTLWIMVWTNQGDAFLVPFRTPMPTIRTILGRDFPGARITRMDIKAI